MPKVEKGRNVKRISEIRKEIEQIKIDRMNAFLDDDVEKVKEYFIIMNELKDELHGLENQNSI